MLELTFFCVFRSSAACLAKCLAYCSGFIFGCAISWHRVTEAAKKEAERGRELFPFSFFLSFPSLFCISVFPSHFETNPLLLSFFADIKHGNTHSQKKSRLGLKKWLAWLDETKTLLWDRNSRKNTKSEQCIPSYFSSGKSMWYFVWKNERKVDCVPKRTFAIITNQGKAVGVRLY